MIARWNSTRDKIAEDERRMSIGGITEMDGEGLYERTDWPLHERRISIPSERERERDKVKATSPVDDGPADENAHILRVNSDEWVIERDVSDIDEDEDEARAEEGERIVNGDDELYDDGEEIQEHLTEPQVDHQPDLSVRRSLDAELERERTNTPIRDRMRPPSAEPEPEVSPVRNEEDEAVASSSRHTPEISRSPDHSRSLDVSRSSDVSRSPDLSQSSQPSPNPSRSSNFSRRSSNDTDRVHTSERSIQYTRGEVDEEPMTNGYSSYDPEEDRDTATPLPQHYYADTWNTSASQSPYQQPSPRTNGDIQTNNHARVSSMQKGSVPPSRSASKRSSIYNTTQIPSNKDRVRYSWQSLQDDEPNRPRIHIIKLVSNVATASAGFPQGEAFGFSISQGGRRIAAYNSARLYVLQTAALPVGISQDYALKRRPLAVEIVDDGNVLAILADEHTVNVYDLSHHRLRRTRTIKLDFPTNCIALAPTGGLLAAAYEGGVEIFSLDASALPTDRRAVRSQKMDRMCFSEDGSTLLGTTTRINVSFTVVVSVPVFPADRNGVPTHEELKEAWCSELLHPENIRNSSHANFMREHRSTTNERLFAWNGLADTFGILNTTDLQYGSVDFPVVISPPLSTCGGLGAAIHSCPAIDEHGDTVAMIVNDRTIRLYIVPHKADDDETTVEAHSIDHELDEGYGCPFNEVRWVYSHAALPAPMPITNQTSVQGRLIVTSPGGVIEPGIPEENIADVEGGRIILFDFDPQFAGQPGQTFSLTLGKSPPQLLEEEAYDVRQEVELVRRRTVNQSKSGGLSQRPITLGRAATTFNSGRSPLRSASPAFLPRRPGSVLSMHSMQSEATRSLPDLVETTAEGSEGVDSSESLGIDEPFNNSAPRSHASLQRANTNAQRHRYQALEERNQERVSVDSNGNFLPLPEYTEEPNAPLPSRFRAMAGLDVPVKPRSRPTVQTTQANGNSTAAERGTAPLTAPASIAETFNSDQAFSAASSSSAGGSTRGNMMPTPNSATISSLNNMPRSLQRAYSNAISPLGSGPAPSLIGDWENVSPIVHNQARPFPPSALSRPSTNGVGGSMPEEDWDSITPVSAPGQPIGPSPFARAQNTVNQNYRYSTSLLNPPGHINPIPNRAPSNASTLGPSSSGGVSTGRRLPPHMQAFRAAAAASASASLFPPTVPNDHVPIPQSRKPQPAGNFAHPITAWHPPAASSTPAIPPPSRARTSIRGHSRQSSLAGKSAFATTEKAKRLGFFSRRRKGQLAGGSGESVMDDGRSMMTWMTGSDRKCAVM